MISNCSYNLVYKFIAPPFFILTSVVGFTLNVLFCAIVWWNAALHKKSLILIVNLSVAGIFNSLTNPTFEIIHALSIPGWLLGRLGNDLFNLLWLFSLVLPFLTAMCIAIERYLATVKSMFYRMHTTSYRLGAVVLAIWVYSIAVMCVIAQFFKETSGDYYVWNVPSTIYYLFLGIHLVIPLMVISALYWLILKNTQKSQERLTLLNIRTFRRDEVEARLAKTLGMVVFSLYIVWVPLIILEIIYTRVGCTVKPIGFFDVWLTTLNECLNPFIYYYRMKEVRKTTRELRKKVSSCCYHCYCCLCCCWRCNSKIIDQRYNNISNSQQEHAL